MITPQTVLNFWFAPETQPLWFAKSDDLDQYIQTHFAELWQRAAHSELFEWRETAHGRLAEIIVLDQFSRNLHRNHPLAFAQDNMAVALAQELLRLPDFQTFTASEKHFALMPLMHSESRVIHAQAESLFAQYAPHALDFELKHKVIIDRFGRYPHRNAILGRVSTAEELAFLSQPNSSF